MHASSRSAAGLIALAVGALVVGCRSNGGTEAVVPPSGSSAPAKTTTTTALAAGPVPGVTVKVLQDHSDSPRYDVTVQVPALHGLAHEATLNGAMEQAARDMISQFVDDVRQQGPPPAGVNPSDPSARSSLTCQSETRLVDPRLASFRLSCAGYNAGAAHPNASVVTFNLDLAGGRLLALDDVFEPGASYLEFLSRAAISQLDARYGDDAAARQGAAPSAANFTAWSLTKTALEITFDDDQVGPHAIGTPTVALDYPILEPYLRHPGPLDLP